MKLRLAVLGMLMLAPAFASAGSIYYATAGTYPFTVPTYTTLTVHVWGAGGGGGGGYYGGGGGGGGYATKTFTTGQLTVGSTISAIVGAKGVTGHESPAVDGTAGGTSQFSSVSAAGGAGGKRTNPNNTPRPFLGGAGGCGSGGTTNTCGTSGTNGDYWGGGFVPGLAGTGGTGASGGGAGGTPVVSGGEPGGGAGGGGYPNLPQSYGGPGAIYITWEGPPTCSISVNPSAIDSGEGSTLTWSSSNATAVRIQTTLGEEYPGWVGTSGSTTLYPAVTKTLRCYATGAGGTSAWMSEITLTVDGSCSLEGVPVNDGESIVAWEDDAPGAGDPCVSQTRTCSSGTLSGTYQYASCTALSGPSCSLGGVTIEDGESHTFYSENLAPSGQLCSAYGQSRTCNNGELYDTSPAMADFKINGSDGPVSVRVGDSAEFFWASHGVDSCTLEHVGPMSDIADWPIFGNGTLGPYTSSHLGTYEWTFECEKTGGGTVSDELTFTVTPPATPPSAPEPEESEYQFGSCACTPLTTWSCPSAQSIASSTVTSACSTVVTNPSATCVSPTFCSTGSAVCLDPTPVFNDDDDNTGHLEARPQIVQKGLSAKLHWSVSNVTSCSVVGNGQTFTGLSAPEGGQSTAAINERTPYTLTCAKIDDTTLVETVYVGVIPVYQEK